MCIPFTRTKKLFLGAKRHALVSIAVSFKFSLPLILFSLKYLIFGKYHSSHTLGVNSLFHWIFPGWYSLFVYRIYEGIQPHYFLISWDSLVRFLLRRHGLVTWCFSAKVSLIRGIWTEIYVNILVIFFEGVYVVGVGNEFEQILCHVKPFVSQ